MKRTRVSDRCWRALALSAVGAVLLALAGTAVAGPEEIAGNSEQECSVEAEGSLSEKRTFKLEAELEDGELEGELEFRDKTKDGKLDFESTSITSLVATGDLASIQGRGKTKASSGLRFNASLDAAKKTLALRLSNGFVAEGTFTVKTDDLELEGSCPFDGTATVLLSPAVKVDHYGVRTREQWPATLRAYGFGDGAFYWKHVRCGDLFALSLLVRQVGRLAAREALSRLGLRRRPGVHRRFIRQRAVGYLGNDNAPTPVEYLLHALAACLTAGIANVAAARGITLTEVTSNVEGDIDLLGILGLSDEVRNGYQQMRVQFHLEGDDADKLRGVVERSRLRSAVYDVLTHGVPVSIDVTTG